MGLKPRRAAADGTVDGYIEALAGDWRGAVVSELRRIVRDAAPTAAEAIKWGQPVFETNGPFCYIQAYSDQINIGFWRGAELDDPEGVLAGDGHKMRHLKIFSSDDIHPAALQAMVRQAVELNRARGNPTR